MMLVAKVDAVASKVVLSAIVGSPLTAPGVSRLTPLTRKLPAFSAWLDSAVPIWNIGTPCAPHGTEKARPGRPAANASTGRNHLAFIGPRLRDSDRPRASLIKRR